jgi:hypothetical protein
MSLEQLALKFERAAPIERLPGEILEKVLIYSLEWNLVRASDIIDRKATGPWVYQIFVFHAFWAYPRDWLKPSRPPGLPYWYQPLSARAQQRLQISIKHTAWFTIEILINMIPVFHRATYCFAAGETIRVPFPNERAALAESPGPADDDVDDSMNFYRTPRVLVYDIPMAALFKPWNKAKLDLLVLLHRNLYHGSMTRGRRRPLLQRRVYLNAIRSALTDDEYWAVFYILLMLKTRDRCWSFATEPVLPGSLFRSALQRSPADGRYLLLLISVCPRSLPLDTCFYDWAAVRGLNDRARAKVLRTLDENSRRRLGNLALRTPKLLISAIRDWRDVRYYTKLIKNLQL